MLIDNWIKTKMGMRDADALTEEKLLEYQLFKLRETIGYAVENSPFYENRLAGFEKDFRTPGDMSKLPLTSEDDLKQNSSSMVCVPQSSVSRIVTLSTSGSTGQAKRIFFTEADQELTIDYFHHGMRIMSDRKDIFLILLPCRTPGSVGDLLRLGLERDGLRVIPFGYPPQDESLDKEIIDLIEKEKVTSLVGTAFSVRRLSQKSRDVNTIRTVLLAADYVPPGDVSAIEENWECEVFEHYGMTETGLGGAMACGAHHGYHPRAADLFFEVIDPVTCDVLPDGQQGELVFTTLTRRAMPLIRYRTGDTSRMITEDCPCGSVLRRLDRVGDRGVRKGY